jgi:hypothetical protein
MEFNFTPETVTALVLAIIAVISILIVIKQRKAVSYSSFERVSNDLFKMLIENDYLNRIFYQEIVKNEKLPNLKIKSLS